ncbi:ankyrin repeat domain-containing protein [Fusarium phyllophilum]|uniref:Ankyrin repeat domain-containing protein n=1 Tax=Fusarium phyllophilum TaxID=47803 RepID=A0A8H5I8W4_9HYPO|nr:ankyrin repeat domain-containing protein [Fusarium phyllophilum]
MPKPQSKRSSLPNHIKSRGELIASLQALLANDDIDLEILRSGVPWPSATEIAQLSQVSESNEDAPVAACYSSNEPVVVDPALGDDSYQADIDLDANWLSSLISHNGDELSEQPDSSLFCSAPERMSASNSSNNTDYLSHFSSSSICQWDSLLDSIGSQTFHDTINVLSPHFQDSEVSQPSNVADHTLGKGQSISTVMQPQHPGSTERDESVSSIASSQVSPRKRQRPHYAIEKRYRAGLQERFEALRDCVALLKKTQHERRIPGTNEDLAEGDDGGSVSDRATVGRMNKAEVLNQATLYIRQLQEENEVMMEYIKLLINQFRVIKQAMQQALKRNPFMVRKNAEAVELNDHSTNEVAVNESVQDVDFVTDVEYEDLLEDDDDHGDDLNDFDGLSDPNDVFYEDNLTSATQEGMIETQAMFSIEYEQGASKALDFDWALISLPVRGQWRPNAFMSTANSPCPLFFSGIATACPEKETAVLIVTSGTVIKQGRLQPVPSFLGGINDNRPSIVWNVIVPELNGLTRGDSGSSAIDARTNVVYGHVVASNPLGEICISPIGATLEQIQSNFPGSNVSLPDPLTLLTGLATFGHETIGSTFQLLTYLDQLLQSKEDEQSWSSLLSWSVSNERKGLLELIDVVVGRLGSISAIEFQIIQRISRYPDKLRNLGLSPDTEYTRLVTPTANKSLNFSNYAKFHYFHQGSEDFPSNHGVNEVEESQPANLTLACNSVELGLRQSTGHQADSPVPHSSVKEESGLGKLARSSAEPAPSRPLPGPSIPVVISKSTGREVDGNGVTEAALSSKLSDEAEADSRIKPDPDAASPTDCSIIGHSLAHPPGGARTGPLEHIYCCSQ